MSHLPPGAVRYGRFAIVPRRGHGTVHAVGIGVLAAFLIGCAADATPDAAMRLRALTVPPDGKAFPPITRRAEAAVETSWIVQTDWSWERYQQWIQDRLKSEFTTITVKANEITCGRLPPTDSHALHFRSFGGAESVRVRVTFTAAKM